MKNGAFTIENLSEREPGDDPFVKREENRFILPFFYVCSRMTTGRELYYGVRLMQRSDDLKNAMHDTI